MHGVHKRTGVRWGNIVLLPNPNPDNHSNLNIIIIYSKHAITFNQSILKPEYKSVKISANQVAKCLN